MPPVNLHGPEAFERVIFLKQNAAWLLEQELKRVDPSRKLRWARPPIPTTD